MRLLIAALLVLSSIGCEDTNVDLPERRVWKPHHVPIPQFTPTAAPTPVPAPTPPIILGCALPSPATGSDTETPLAWAMYGHDVGVDSTGNVIVAGSVDAPSPTPVLLRGFHGDGAPAALPGCETDWLSITFAGRLRFASSPTWVVPWPDGTFAVVTSVDREEPAGPYSIRHGEIAMVRFGATGVEVDSLRYLPAAPGWRFSHLTHVSGDADGVVLVFRDEAPGAMRYRIERWDRNLERDPTFGWEGSGGSVLIGVADELDLTVHGDTRWVAMRQGTTVSLYRMDRDGNLHDVGSAAFDLRDVHAGSDGWDLWVFGVAFRPGRGAVFLAGYDNGGMHENNITGRVLVAFDTEGARDDAFAPDGVRGAGDCARSLIGTPDGFRLVGLRNYTILCTRDVSNDGSESITDLDMHVDARHFRFAGNAAEHLLVEESSFPSHNTMLYLGIP